MSEPRIVGADDRIGRSVSRVLRDRVGSVGVDVRTGIRVTGIVPRSDGSLVVEIDDDDRDGPVANAVVVATGGGTWARATSRGVPSTNPPNDNDALRTSLRGLGLDEVGMDHWQHQPFGLVDVPDGPTVSTVPETIVEHGVRLVDRFGDEVVDVHAGRLAVTAAIEDAVASGRGVETENGSGCLLTLSDVPEDVLAEAFPATARILRRAGLLGADVVVRPALHYQLGGFAIEPDTSTTVPGLYLAGEVTGGTHGRNRLMGAGLLESLVLGRRAGVAARAWADQPRSSDSSGQ